VDKRNPLINLFASLFRNGVVEFVRQLRYNGKTFTFSFRPNN